MSLSPYKIFVAGEILLASDLNASFAQITSNGLQLISPLTGTLDADGKTIILDADADSNMAASTDDVLNLTLQSFLAFIFDGNVASPVNGITFETTATGVGPLISAHGETNVTLRLKGKGTGAVVLVNEDSEGLSVSKNDTNEVLLTGFGSGADVALVLKGKGASKIQLGDAELQWPDSDGTSGDVLSTNGSGVLSFGRAVPAGTIIDWGGTGAPTGYLACDGSNVSRTTYAALFAAIGETWGAGDGSTTFGLPDLRRRVTVGVGGSGTGTLGNAVGNTGGAETVNLQHTHAQQGTFTTTASGVSDSATLGATGFIGSHTHDVTISGNVTNGLSTTQTIMQPSAVVGKYIKT
jgi:microcystin-dependent protein